MRKLLLGLIGSAMIGLGSMAVAPAQAAMVPAAAVESAQVQKNGVQTVQYYRNDYYRRGRVYGRTVVRPVPRPAVRCWVERKRAWNGYRYIVRSVRVCR